jgi:CMP-N-acetylneuraminic acid synthetase
VHSVILLQPTSPIRNPIEVSNALRYFYENNLESLVSVTEMREHPFECIKFNSKNWEFLEKPEGKVTRRQDYINKYFFIDGSFYLVKKDFLYRNNTFVKQGETYLYETNLRYSIDIDVLEDINIAEAILKKGNI